MTPPAKPPAKDDRFAGLPFSVEDQTLMAARAHVLGCSPAMLREMMKREDAEAAQWERIEALERTVNTLTTLVIGKKK
jgi:hypothetical protein